MKSVNQNLIKITELLSDGQYHDGTSVGNELHITRAAVWKAIKKLQEYHVPLTSIKGKGYRLESPLILLAPDKIKTRLSHQPVQLIVLEKTKSTNEHLKSYMNRNRKVIVCMAEMQTQGKGRLHRQWHSPFGENIYFSLLCPFEKDIGELSGVSLVVSLAICHAIESVIPLKDSALKIKWPNDVMAEGSKLAGTLIEIQAESNGFCQVIIGIGVNVNMNKALKKEIDQPWSSLLNLTSQHWDRNILCAAMINSLIDYLERFSLKGLTVFIKEWKKRDSLAESLVSIVSGKEKITGICAGINDKGHLLLNTKEKGMLAFSSGDATLLK